MDNFKSVLIVICTGLFMLTGVVSTACIGPISVNKPSNLPSLVVYTCEYENNKFHIYTVNLDGTNAQPVSSDNQTNDGTPTWSADGAKIIFSSDQSDNWEIWSMNSDGTDRRKLTNRPRVNMQPRQSPDGKKIVFVGAFREFGEIPREEVRPTYEIMVANSDGSSLNRLTTSSKSGNGWNLGPAWSPDSSRIIFSTNRENADIPPILYIMNADGSNQTRFGLISPIDGADPDWSVTTNKVVFVRNSDGKGAIWVMDGGLLFPAWAAKKVIDNFGNIHNPVWSPDGKQIAFVSDVYGNDNIFIMSADGSNVHRLTSGTFSDNHPSWR